MTKEQIVAQISSSTGVDKKVALPVVEAFMEVVQGALAKKENVYLRGFGSFVIKHREEKIARNISKNTTIVIPAHDIPAFKPAKAFVDLIK